DPSGRVQQWDCVGNVNQGWQLNDIGNGNFELKNQASGECLDAWNPLLVSNGCNGTDAQRFRLTQSYHNTGTTAGWDFINQEHNGYVTEVTNVFYKGPTAIKVGQIYDPNYTGRYHSEVVKNDAYRRGDTAFYGFAFRLQSDWDFQNQTYNI